MKLRRRSSAAALVTAAALAVGVGLAAAPLSVVAAHATGFVPTQFIAKLYTEALGRAPDASGWTTRTSYFATNGCSAATLSSQINTVFASSEYSALGYSTNAQLEVAYRTVLNREPDAAGLSYYSGASLSTVLAGMEASSEFASLASTICSTTDYHFGTAAPVSLSPTGAGYSGTEVGLQTLLNAAAPGSTVYLAQRALIPLTTTLIIPGNVTLSTTGAPTPNHYAEMGRLSRSPGWSGNSVLMYGSSHVSNVWVDGDRLRESSYDRLRFNLRINAGANTSLTYSRVGNTAGATSMQVDGDASTASCSGTVIANNLIDSYTANHDGVSEADGISTVCGAASVHDNSVIDASDVGIILFGSPGYTQSSQVYHNTLVQSGHGAHAIMALDSSTSSYPSTVSAVSFSGASMHDNVMWSGSNAVSTFGLSVGTFAYFGPSTLGTGGSVTNNTSGSLSVTAESGIGVSGILSTTVTGNTLNWVVGVDVTSSCPNYAVGASVSAGYASGTIQPYTDATYSRCWDVP